MLKRVLGTLFRHTPRSVRLFLTRLGHTRFTISAGAVVIDDEGRILLLKHVFRAGSGWGIPGGFIKQGEQPEEALRRELREEIGLEIERIELVFVRTFTHRQLEIGFRCRARGGARPQSVEIEKLAWFSPSDLPESLAADQRRLIDRVLSDGAKRQS